ncbi:hypothetical protein OB920_13070 [Halobacteria archaeon HArc-gm2]|nr:hypothetical protein [Halobacteria archaeon HArc-gm2]
MATANAGTFTKLGIVSTLVDAAVAFARGNRLGGAVLLAAAALSSKIPGIGVAASVAFRIVKRLR